MYWVDRCGVDMIGIVRKAVRIMTDEVSKGGYGLIDWEKVAVALLEAGVLNERKRSKKSQTEGKRDD